MNLNTLFCFGIVILAIVGVIYAIRKDRQEKADRQWYSQEDKKRRLEERSKRIQEAKIGYSAALDQLRKDPGNTELRETALQQGRIYANLARDDRRSMFDEVALMNDLSAIQPTTQATDPNKTTKDVKSRLIDLESLYNDGIITKEEFEERRNEILSEL